MAFGCFLMYPHCGLTNLCRAIKNSAQQLSHDIDNLTEHRQSKQDPLDSSAGIPNKSNRRALSKRIADRLNVSMSPKIDEIFHGTPIDIRYKTVKFNIAQKIREIYRHAGIESSKADSPLILFKAGQMEWPRARLNNFRFRSAPVISGLLLLNCSCCRKLLRDTCWPFIYGMYDKEAAGVGT